MDSRVFKDLFKVLFYESFTVEVEDSSAALGELKNHLLAGDSNVLDVDGDSNCPVRPSYRVKRKCHGRSCMSSTLGLRRRRTKEAGGAAGLILLYMKR